jgi:hypothetical protein
MDLPEFEHASSNIAYRYASETPKCPMELAAERRGRTEFTVEAGVYVSEHSRSLPARACGRCGLDRKLWEVKSVQQWKLECSGQAAGGSE